MNIETRTVMKRLSHPLICLALWCAPALQAADDHDHEAEGQAEHAAEVVLMPARQQAAGIRVEPLAARMLANEVSAPGEVKLNAYLTRQVTAGMTAQVAQRHVALGDHVRQGQPLVTLSSAALAEAEGALVVAVREWRRVQDLGREIVADRRYSEARVAAAQARARLVSYGMTNGQIDALLAGKTGADGSLQLLAPQAGTIVRDAFIAGELVEPGRVLFEISDETRVWVEASLMPQEASGITAGTPARIRVGDDWLAGKVIQSHHALNEATRTLAVRIEVPNPDERLHPGLFVETRIQAGGGEKVLALPEEAVLRSPDGDWMVFIEDEPNRFRPVEVELVRSVDKLAVIKGLAAGTRVVTRGAFFVQSELAKGGFDVHNH